MVAQIAGKAIVLIGAAITASGITASVMHYVNRSKVQKARDAGQREGQAREKARQEEVRLQSNAAQAEMLATFVENQALIWLALALVTVGGGCMGSLLEEIAEGIATISGSNIQVASAAEQQSQDAEEIHRSVNDINTLVIQVSAGAEQTAVTSRELARLAEHQQGLVGRFKVN